jgi:hypothetical protein
MKNSDSLKFPCWFHDYNILTNNEVLYGISKYTPWLQHKHITLHTYHYCDRTPYFIVQATASEFHTGYCLRYEHKVSELWLHCLNTKFTSKITKFHYVSAWNRQSHRCSVLTSDSMSTYWPPWHKRCVLHVSVFIWAPTLNLSDVQPFQTKSLKVSNHQDMLPINKPFTVSESSKYAKLIKVAKTSRNVCSFHLTNVQNTSYVSFHDTRQFVRPKSFSTTDAISASSPCPRQLAHNWSRILEAAAVVSQSHSNPLVSKQKQI